MRAFDFALPSLPLLSVCGSLIAVSLFACAGEGQGDAAAAIKWKKVYSENFNRPLDSRMFPWRRDPQGPASPWHIDGFDDDGEIWHKISDPQFRQNMQTLSVYRKRIVFGTDGWLTAEIAAVDKTNRGAPDSEPYIQNTLLEDGSSGLKLEEPEWDAGIIIRPTHKLPAHYRVEVTLRYIDFGGKRNGSFDYDGKHNGYRPGECKTGFPWTFKGSLEGKSRCDYGSVVQENGFYYLAILDHDNPAPHGNPGIHYRRKVIMDGYYSDASWSQKYGVCNPATKKIESVKESSNNGVNAIFIRGDKFRSQNNNIGNEYYFKTACGNYDGSKPFGDKQQFSDILTSAELVPEKLPQDRYQFAVERDYTGYTLEMKGPFAHIGETTLRFHHDFIEDGRPIWHFNQTPEEYQGQFNQTLVHTGYAGEYSNRENWPAGSSWPDTFIIGDPHLNYYEGSAIISNITLYVPEESTAATQ